MLGAFFALASAHEARADLRAEAGAVASELRAEGGVVAQLDPVFLDAGGMTVIEPVKAVASSDTCVTLVVLGVRTADFAVTRGRASEPIDDQVARFGAPGDARGGSRGDDDAKPSALAENGLYARTACGEDAPELERVIIRMRTTRATHSRDPRRTNSHSPRARSSGSASAEATDRPRRRST